MRNKITKETRKVMNRSGSYECNICKEKAILVEHHINGRDIPRPNHASNLAHICDNCHRLCHEGLIIIEGWFTTSDGLQLLHHSVDATSFSGRDSKPYIIPS